MTDGITKTDEFSEKFQRGGRGVIFNPKIYIADFCHYRRYFGHEFHKKFAIQLSEKWGGGGQLPFGTFPKIHPFWKGKASLRNPPKNTTTEQFFILGILLCLFIFIWSKVPDAFYCFSGSNFNQLHWSRGVRWTSLVHCCTIFLDWKYRWSIKKSKYKWKII